MSEKGTSNALARKLLRRVKQFPQTLRQGQPFTETRVFFAAVPKILARRYYRVDGKLRSEVKLCDVEEIFRYLA